MAHCRSEAAPENIRCVSSQVAGDSTCWSGCGGNGQEQNVIQIGETKQDADADAKAKQDAVNANTPLSVIGDHLSGSGTSSAKQMARNNADADATNKNDTDQSASQNQGGSGGIQTGTQSAGNTQLAGALSTASQTGATNTNIPVRVLSPGSNGNVTQSNTVSSTASSTKKSTSTSAEASASPAKKSTKKKAAAEESASPSASPSATP